MAKKGVFGHKPGQNLTGKREFRELEIMGDTTEVGGPGEGDSLKVVNDP